MSRIDDLIQKSCPNGVEFKTLGELGQRNKGTSITAARMKQIQVADGPVRVFAGGQTIADVAEGAIPEKDVVRETSIVVKSRGNIGFSYYDRPFTHKSELWSYTINRQDVNQKFVYYYLLTQIYRLQELARATSVKLPQLGVKDTDTLLIPIPPLGVQQEIAKILDLFTGLEAELEAELEARRRQYAFYLDSLLTVSEAKGVRRIALGEIAEFKYGFTASAQDEGDYRFLRITDISPWGKLSPFGAKFIDAGNGADDYVVRSGDVLMARTGATYGKTMLVDSEEPAVYASFLIRIRLDESVMLPSYYWHFAQSDLYWSQANAMVSRGGQPQFNANVLKLVEVPIPSLNKQARAITLLNKFDSLVNNLSVGLPAELAARRKQYEYYRNRLLTFKEKVT